MEKIVRLLGKELPEESKIEKMCKDANVNYNKVKVLIDEFNDDKEFVTDEVISKMYKNSSNKSKKVVEILNVLTFAHIDICESEDKDIDSKKYLNDIKNIVNESNYKNLDKFYTSVLEYIESSDDSKFSLDSIVSDNQSSTNYVDKLVSDKEEKNDDKHVTVTINRTIEDKVLDMIEENAAKDKDNEQKSQEENEPKEPHVKEEKQNNPKSQSSEKSNTNISPVVALLTDADIEYNESDNVDNMEEVEVNFENQDNVEGIVDSEECEYMVKNMGDLKVKYPGIYNMITLLKEESK